MDKIIRKGLNVVVIIIGHGILSRNAAEPRYAVVIMCYPRITAVGNSRVITRTISLVKKEHEKLTALPACPNLSFGRIPPGFNRAGAGL